MTVTNVLVEKKVFILNNRCIAIDKKIVEQYAEIVCPITERLLTTYINTLGENCSDAVLSAKIETDMEKELGEYGY